MEKHKIRPKKQAETAVKVSLVSIFGNLALALLKALAGILANSGAMISDAVHSASDVLSSCIVIVGIKLAAKQSDKDHPYGHERFECVAAIVLSGILLLSGLLIGLSAVEKLQAGDTQAIAIPGLLALIAAIVSIAVKEAMYWYTRFYAISLDSGALLADAWHQRSDALSSVGALIGILGARMGFLWMDAVASLVICLFILKVAFDVFRDAIGKMVDHACSEELEQDIRECALAQSGVVAVDVLRSRMFGNKIYVEMHICAPGELTLAQSHQIAQQVHDALEQQFEKIKHITVCVKPLSPS